MKKKILKTNDDMKDYVNFLFGSIQSKFPKLSSEDSMDMISKIVYRHCSDKLLLERFDDKENHQDENLINEVAKRHIAEEIKHTKKLDNLLGIIDAS